MFTVKGVIVEAIEVFRDHVLIQEVESKAIYLISLQDLEVDADTPSESSNIISLKGWKQWQEDKVENAKVRQKARINKRLQPKRQTSKLLMLAR